VRHVRTLTLTFSLCVSALFLSSCGDGSEKLLSERDAGQLTSWLRQIDQFASDGSCSTAAEATTKVLQQIDSLPESTDPRLRQRLTEGAQSLQELVNDPAGCTPASATPSFTPSEPTETNPSGKEKPTPPGHERKEPPGNGGAPAPDTTTTPTDTGGDTTPPSDTTPEPTP
jgi:hypothetical protein